MDEKEGAAGRLLWTPSAERMQRSRMAHYRAWLEAQRSLRLATQADLWRWSVSEIEAFWESLWDYFDVGPKTYSAVLSSRKMPGARWFVGAEVNYAERILAPRGARLAVIHRGEGGVRRTLSHAELVLSVARVRRGLERQGVARGDRVVGYVNNDIEALVAFLATASLGAIWSSCPPEFGVESVLDRFSQISPKVMFARGGYDYGGKHFDRRAEVERLVSALGSLSACVSIGEPRPEGSADAASRSTNLHRFAMEDWLSEPLPDFDGTCPVDAVPFEHPLWILFSSGTTGLPKPIVHGHGGMLLEHLKVLALHSDLGDGDRFFWFSTTGWMMWNYLVGGLLVGATIVLYDGSPNSPDLGTLWRLAAEEKLTYFGASAPFLMACRAAKLVPSELGDLGALRSVGSTGAPLPAAGFEWVYDAVSKDVLLASVSGGTDLCTAFVASSPLLPVHAGELQCLGLGAKVQALDAEGKPVIGQVGELVIAEPMPCMPVSFWNDPSGARYRESYFEHYPGLWRHGDW
jgi:acetoacetyl-CoA synthetase